MGIVGSESFDAEEQKGVKGSGIDVLDCVKTGKPGGYDLLFGFWRPCTCRRLSRNCRECIFVRCNTGKVAEKPVFIKPGIGLR